MGKASYVDDCLLGYEDAEKTKKFLGLITKSKDGKKISYDGTISRILKLAGFEAKCMITDHETDEDVIRKFFI